MLKVRCKNCNVELESSNKLQACGCPNMMTIKNDNITARDLSQVVMVNSNAVRKKAPVLTPEDLQFQESRRNRTIRKLTFEIR